MALPVKFESSVKAVVALSCSRRRERTRGSAARAEAVCLVVEQEVNGLMVRAYLLEMLVVAAEARPISKVSPLETAAQVVKEL